MTSKREWNPTKTRMSDVVAILTDPTESGLKEKTTVLVPRYGAEVAKYDETLERQRGIERCQLKL